jgi:hypothetical protein
MSVNRWLAASSLVFALVASVASAAVRDNPTIRFNATDQKLAKAMVLRMDDGFAQVNQRQQPAWKGGFVKPLGEGVTWPGYTHKGLVVTGAAATSFARGGAYVDTNVWVLQTREMAQLYGRRLTATPVLDEIRSDYADAPASVRLVSVSHIPRFPKIAPVTIAVRVAFDVTYTDGETQRWIDDYIDLVQDRSVISLTVGAFYSERNSVRLDEIAFSKLLVERATLPKVLDFMLMGPKLEAPAGQTYVLDTVWVQLDKVLAGKNGTWMDTPPIPMLGVAPASCTATLGGVPISGSGKGGCRWQIPSTAAGKTLVVAAKVSLMGADATIKLPVPVTDAEATSG